MRHDDGRVIVFPHHDEVDRYTLRGALKDASVELDDFCGRSVNRRYAPYRPGKVRWTLVVCQG
jgi:phage gp36-like protein